MFCEKWLGEWHTAESNETGSGDKKGQVNKGSEEPWLREQSKPGNCEILHFNKY